MSEEFLIIKEKEAKSLVKQGKAVFKDGKRIVQVRMGEKIVECFYNENLKVYNRCSVINENIKRGDK